MNTEKRFKKLIIISSPSGAGKTTICKYLLKKIKNVELSISYTTRHIRINEIHGKDYYFINKEKFLTLIKKNFFIEFARVFRNHYGSPHSNINKAFKNNNHILFDIDWQGARKLRNNFPVNQIIDFFILPPNKKEISIRLSHAIREINHYTDYKYVLINENINETVNNLLNIINHEVLISSIEYKVNKKLKFIK